VVWLLTRRVEDKKSPKKKMITRRQHSRQMSEPGRKPNKLPNPAAKIKERLRGVAKKFLARCNQKGVAGTNVGLAKKKK